VKLTTTKLRELIRLTLKEEVSSSAKKALSRAVKSKSAGPVSTILLNNLPPVWRVANSAPAGSNATDIVLSDTMDNEVSIEVKDYGNDAVFKVEISIAEESALATLFGISRTSFSASPDAVAKRIVGRNRNSILSSIENVLSGEGKQYIGVTEIDTKGTVEKRHIIVMKGPAGDWSRVRHASEPNGTPRMIYTVSSADVASRAAESGEVPLNEIAAAVRDDFTSKGDQYLFLYDGSSKIRGFSLTRKDPLGLKLPLLAGSSIQTYSFGTHGGGMRPAIKVVVREDSGRILE